METIVAPCPWCGADRVPGIGLLCPDCREAFRAERTPDPDIDPVIAARLARYVGERAANPCPSCAKPLRPRATFCDRCGWTRDTDALAALTWPGGAP